MDLTYLIVAVFGMYGIVAVRSLPTAAATDATTTTSSPQVADESGKNNGKRGRMLFQSPPSPYNYQGAASDPFSDMLNDVHSYYPQQQQQEQQYQQQEQYQQQQQQQEQQQRFQQDDDLRTAAVDDVDQDLRLSSRARPSAKPDSPVYFIRLPPQPYMYVPGYGYVSQPTRLEPPPFTQRPHSPFLNLPIGFVSNGKPVGVYTLPQQHQLPARPKPHRRPQVPQPPPPPPPPPPQPQQHQQQSPIYNLDKGPYVFNGRPSDVFLLQSAYDNLYSEVLQNIYP